MTDLIKQLREYDNNGTAKWSAPKKAAAEITRLQFDLDTAWSQAHRLALELECLLTDCKDNAVQSKWWDSALEAISEYHDLKPGAAEEAEAWRKMRQFERQIDSAREKS